MARDRCVLMFFIANPVCVTEHFISTICRALFSTWQLKLLLPLIAMWQQIFGFKPGNLSGDRANGKSPCNKLPDKSVSNMHFSKWCAVLRMCIRTFKRYPVQCNDLWFDGNCHLDPAVVWWRSTAMKPVDIRHKLIFPTCTPWTNHYGSLHAWYLTIFRIDIIS